VTLVETWVAGLYGRTLSKKISKDKSLTDQQKLELRCIGKYNIQAPRAFGKGKITKEMVDLYWSWVWSPDVAGSPPTVTDRLPMIMSEMTCDWKRSKKAKGFEWWLGFSCLQPGRRIQIPIRSTPYLKDTLQKTVICRKQQKGWVFQFTEKTPDLVLDGSKGKIGLDVGLNCLAATSDGRIYGNTFKPKFDKTWNQVKKLRSNRQRQGLKENSPRLSKLEQKLTGQTKTATGTVSNKLVKSFPGHTFVIEDLDLRGCRGQKRFAYRALHHNLETKAVIKVVNPAYTSQECPSCGHVAHGNRKGINFCCTGCGRKGHADWVGSFNLLRRSEDKQIGIDDNPLVVKRLLETRYREQRSCKRSSVLTPEPGKDRQPRKGHALRAAPVPSGRKLTVVVSDDSESSTASNSIPRIS